MNKIKFEQKMAQLRFLRRKKINKRNRALRKERTKQRVAFGVLLEESYKSIPAEFQYMFIESAQDLLSGRNLGLALEGFARLNKTRKGRE